MSDANQPDTTPAAPTDLLRVVRKVLKPFASLQVTVVLFSLSVLLVFFGTLAQKNAGVWTVVDHYFYSWFVWVDYQLFVNFAQVFFQLDPAAKASGAFPFPAGKLIGWAMFVNLLAAHLLRFKLSWKRSGIFLLHAGVLLMLLGEYVTREFQVEQRMQMFEGKASRVAFDIRDSELAFVTPGSEPDTERVVVVPAKLLTRAAKSGTRISSELLPVDVAVLRWMSNSQTMSLAEATKDVKDSHLATSGLGSGDEALTAKEMPEVNGTDENQIADIPAAFVTLYQKGTDTELGRYLLSTDLSLRGLTESLTLGGETYAVSLRFTQYTKPYTLTLVKFTHEKYLGTELPKNFCSRVRIDDEERDVHREVDIAMNEPLRYRGEAYFQSGFDPASSKTSTLQVVRNPGWTLPYISCGLVTLGMTVHFLIFLVRYLTSPGTRKRMQDSSAAPVARRVTTPVADRGLARRAGFLGGALASVVLLYAGFAPRKSDGELNLTQLAATPVVEGGRLKPLDTVARVTLRRLNEREDMTTAGGQTYSAMKWYMEVASSSLREAGRAHQYPVFRIQNLEVLSLLELKPRSGWRYTLDEIARNLPKLKTASERARRIPEKERTPFEQKVLDTASQVQAYSEVAVGDVALVLPPRDGTEWRSFWTAKRDASLQAEVIVIARHQAEIERHVKNGGTAPTTLEGLAEILEAAEPTQEGKARVTDAMISEARAAMNASDPDIANWDAVLAAYRSGSAERFDTAVQAHQESVIAKVSSGDRFRIRLELFLNQFAPYFYAACLYGVALALSLIGWVLAVGTPGASQAIRRATFWLIFVTFLAHTFSLLCRMYLMDRPLVFVTNLYSSAVFIGWVAAGVCLLLERIFPIGLGNLVAAALGLGTCIIGHQIASGDTLEMMRAVLDTNFWLATHVTTVTFGYSATYIAGVIGIVYIVVGLFTPRLNNTSTLSEDGVKTSQSLGKLIGQAMYGVICMATLFSFVGTVLGGIWADQSWGRFWGWDPKENGAVMIVIWNALILHARWCGLVKNRGTALLALVGNMITTWSWFGTNQLGVGLHAYGFNNTLALLCVLVWASHLAIIVIALAVPPQYWRSDVSKA